MSESLVGFLSDPSTLMALGAVAVGTAWYLSSGGTPSKPPLPLDNQSIEVCLLHNSMTCWGAECATDTDRTRSEEVPLCQGWGVDDSLF